MNALPTVSTVIPNYNNARFLEHCVESIAAQDYPNIEIVVVDDASTDDSREVLRALQTKHPCLRVIHQDGNVGITLNRKRGIEAATGEYVNYLDSDDYVQNRSKLSEEMRLIRHFEDKYGETVIAFSDVLIADADGRPVARFRDMKPAREGFILPDLLSRRCLVPQNFTLRKSAYLNVGGHDESIPFYENWDLKIRLAAKYRYVFTGVPGFVYRRHGIGLSNARLDRHVQWVSHIVDKNLPLVDEQARPLVELWCRDMIGRLGEELAFINQHLPPN
jgi:glycosyltransferase involved in cell wall biosynthesis